ncbi:MAG TPA: histidine phosphatase family protein [Candidatus Nanopelagicaceae bacterium]|nr:histidine phosphatase family protein [Candidatus Nanopelagicaceae bacterium]
MPITDDHALTTCYLVRHCDVENPNRVIYGHLPNFGLSEKGRLQGRALASFLSARPVRAIYASPLQRAQETASLIEESFQPPLPLQLRLNLVEAEFGRYLQGTRYQDIIWRRPKWIIHMLWPGLAPGDESMPAMYRRVRTAIQEGLAAHPGEAFICISHGDPIQAFWATVDHRPPWALHRLQCAKGGLLELKYRGLDLVQKQYLAPDELLAMAAAGERRDSAAVPADRTQ